MKRKTARRAGKKSVAGARGKRVAKKGGKAQVPKGAKGTKGAKGAKGPKKRASSDRPEKGRRGAGKGRGPSPSGSARPGRRPGKPRQARPMKAAEPLSHGPERLQKILAAAGLGSRRQCEELILTGRVEVDRKVVTELGTRVDLQTQHVRVDGVELRKPKTVWYALNKPVGVLCTNRDPGGRPRAIDLVPGAKERLFPVGRLDMNSEGLLLLTNDGDLANRLAHPRYGITKTYRVLVAGQPTAETMTQLRKGVYLAEGLTKITGVTIKRRYKKATILEMVLQEGKNREIRRVLARLGHKVMRLVRVGMGPVKLGELGPGDSRLLTPKEMDALRRHGREGKS